ncbi:hypothetical protein [Noviherbaspirillum autotrophicum]|uniref:hypothetical protein n=1 Tax=Noviherbaspirillum autotrophicum TaxID=709839 RepID=UPI0012FDF047|nr:hypothetical protein [Noviherbaspirillum autotrophicum]
MTSDKRKKTGARHARIAFFSVVLLAQGVSAQSAESASVAARYPSGSIRSVEAAEQALVDAAKERAEVEQRFLAEKNACLSRFFASSCEEGAREQRRAALEGLKAVEVEANAFKRRERVIERDRALEEKRVQDEKERQERMRQQDERAAQPRAQAEPRQNAEKAVQAEARSSDRQARHQEKLRRIEADEAANAQKRANNIAEYQKKVQAAQAHQQEVERRKAEKEREAQQRATPPATR